MIVLDLVLATRRKEATGIERYGINLFKAMRELVPETYALVADDGVIEGPGVISVGSVGLGWLGVPLTAARLAAGRTSTVICPSYPASPLFHLSRLRLIRVIHDCFAWTRAENMSRKGRLLFRSLESAMAPRYDVVAAPTDIVARELGALLNRQIAVAGNAAGLAIGELGAVAVPALAGRRFVLLVGTVEPRKNYEALLDIVSRTDDPDLVFVVAGRPGWGEIVSRLGTAASDERLVWLRDASDSQLQWLYQNCAGFLSLSHAEGFNMPLVEAGMSGCEIVCSDLPVHRAVGPEWAVFVPGNANDETIAAIRRLDGRRRTDTSGYRSRFGWREVARRFVDMDRNLVGGAGAPHRAPHHTTRVGDAENVES